MRQRQIAVIRPQRVRGNVADDHWLSTVSGRSTRTRGRADDHAINSLSIRTWQAGRRSMPKTVGTGVRQKDRTQRTAGQFFDESAYRIEDETARITPGYHLQKLFLPGQQHLGTLAVLDIKRRCVPCSWFPC